MDFADHYKNILEIETKSYIRHFLVNNKPYAFDKCPLIYEQVIQYFADNIEINPNQIKLIGSGKTGFSISETNYGRPYVSEKSDLDFSIISEKLFYELQEEFESWAKLYKGELIKPLENLERVFWPQNLITGPNQIKRGFIDVKFIPNREPFPKTRKINSSLFYIKKYLADINRILIKEGSVSIYRSWNSFMKRIQFNTEEVLNKIT
jgi:hypothetical protein